MFNDLQSKMAAQSRIMEKLPLFKVEISDDIFQAYLSCFPDPEIKQHHNCNCCKSFLRQYGKVIAIENNKIITLWDFEIDGVYSEVPKVLGDLVRNAAISGHFLSDIGILGTPQNSALNKQTNEAIIWHHFHWKLPRNILVPNGTVDSRAGDLNSTRGVFHRALTELKLEAITAVKDLIDQNLLYRGNESVELINQLIAHKVVFDSLDIKSKDLYSWEYALSKCSRIRNTSLGTLLVDLSEGRSLESAVAAYERMVAPDNYKRPTSLVTQKMIENAEAKIIELGLKDSLSRRYAKSTDISINNALFVNRNKSASGLFEEMKENIVIDVRKLKVDKEIGINEFLSKVVPNSSSIELLLENRLSPNFMTLIAPVYLDSPNLFKWDNNFSWSYAEGLADSLKEKVKQAGGKTDGELRISLEWYNLDDLDLHVTEPSRNHIYFGNRTATGKNGGLDVDMNAGSGTTRTPVENCIFLDKNKMAPGDYIIDVKNYRKRETTDVGFNVEVECKGDIMSFGFKQSPSSDSTCGIAVINYDKDKGITLVKGEMKSSITASKQVYGIGTNKFHKVNMITLSPNYWGDNKVVNKHFFFILEGAKAENPPRAIFNEFLRNDLTEHRKVLEVLGSKIKVEDSSEQLNGIGFSETLPNSCIMKVDNQLMKVNFGGNNNG